MRAARRALAAGRAPPARPIDLQADLMRFTVDAISGLAFGADVNTLESDDDIIQRHLDKIFPALFRRLLRAVADLALVEDPRRPRARRERRRGQCGDRRLRRRGPRRASPPTRRAATAPANLLEAMIVAADDPGSGITDGEVAGNVMTMLLAGEDTTANTLAWMI